MDFKKRPLSPINPIVSINKLIILQRSNWGTIVILQYKVVNVFIFLDRFLDYRKSIQIKMPHRKKFIDKKKAITFQLVHRSQHDPLIVDDTVGERVLVPLGVSF